MAFCAVLRVVLRTKIVKHFAGGAARLAEGHGVGCSCTAPPILFRVIIKDASSLHAEAVTILTGTDNHLLRIDTFLREQFFPDYGGFGISLGVVFLVADKRGHIETVGIESELIRKKFKKP